MISFKQGAHHHATVASIFAAPFSEILKPHVILQIAFLDLPLDIPRLDRRGAGARGELERRACRPVNKVADGIEEKLVMAEYDHLCGLVRFTGSHDLFGGHCSAEVIEAGAGVIEFRSAEHKSAITSLLPLSFAAL